MINVHLRKGGFPYVEELYTGELTLGKVLMPDGIGGLIWGSGLLNEPEEESLPALATTGNYQLASNIGIGGLPVAGGYVMVFVNGLFVKLGDGVRTRMCYFSDDAGATAKALANLAAGDLLYWNGDVAGYDLDVTDSIEIYYFLA